MNLSLRLPAIAGPALLLASAAALIAPAAPAKASVQATAYRMIAATIDRIDPVIAEKMRAQTPPEQPSTRGMRIVHGTPGKDRIAVRGTRSSFVNAGGGADTVLGGRGNDVLDGQWGPDTIRGRWGDNYIVGGSGSDRLYGGTGDDVIVGGVGHDLIDARRGGNNKLYGGDGPDRIIGGPGDDDIYGGSGPDVIDASRGGDNFIDPGTSAPDVVAGPGDDHIVINAASRVKRVDCGAGFDTLYIIPAGEPGHLGQLQALADGRIRNCNLVIQLPREPDPLEGAVRISRSTGSHTLRGTDRNDKLLGGPGSTVARAVGGDNIIWGNHLPGGQARGTNRLYGGSGENTIYGASSNRNTVRNFIYGGPSNDYLQGGGGRRVTNTIRGRAGDNTIYLRTARRNTVYAGRGNNVIYAFARGRTTIDCGPGRDTVYWSFNHNMRLKRCNRVIRWVNGKPRRERPRGR